MMAARSASLHKDCSFPARGGWEHADLLMANTGSPGSRGSLTTVKWQACSLPGQTPRPHAFLCELDLSSLTSSIVYHALGETLSDIFTVDKHGHPEPNGINMLENTFQPLPPRKSQPCIRLVMWHTGQEKTPPELHSLIFVQSN